MKKSTLISLAMVGTVASGSIAGVSTYQERNSFLSILTGAIGHDDFENYQVDMANGARSLEFEGFNVSYDGGNRFGVDNVNSEWNGVGATSGAQYIRADFGYDTARSVTFTFTELVNDFGVMIRDLELTSLTYQTNSGLSGVAADLTGNDEIQFFGISTGGEQPLAFTSITFTMAGQEGAGRDGVMFDQLTYATTTVPAPGAMGLLGLGGLVMGRRRR